MQPQVIRQPQNDFRLLPEIGNPLQRNPAGPGGSRRRQNTEDLQPHRVRVVTDDFLAFRRHQHHAQRQRQNQAVECAHQHQRLNRPAKHHEYDRRKGNKQHDDVGVISFDRRRHRAQKGNAGIRRADNGSDCCRPKDETKKLVPQIASGMPENGSRRIGRIQLQACGYDTQRRQENNDAHDAGDQDTGHGGAVDARQVFMPRHARVEQAMPAGKRNVAADRTADQRNRRQHQRSIIIGKDGFDDRLADRRIRGKHHVSGEQDHQSAQNFGDPVHRQARFFRGKNTNGDNARDNGAGFNADTEQHIDRHARSAHIADVEGQPAGDNQQRDEVPQAGKDLVGDILTAHTAHRNHTPDVHLRADVDHNRSQNGKGKVGGEFFGKYGRLRQKSRPNRRGGHDKRGAKQHRPVGFALRFGLVDDRFCHIYLSPFSKNS